MIETSPEHFKLGDLHADIETLASLVHYYSDEAAKARSKKDSLEVQLELRMAQVETTLRADIARNGGSKPTESQIKAMVIQNKDVIQLNLDIVKATEDLNVLMAAVKAMDAKRDSINNKVRLTVSKATASLDISSVEASALAVGH